MRDSAVAQLDSPDELLITSTRGGDRRAFAELWRRHYRSGLTVARQFTNIDADDLVSESFARIYKRTVEGGGPTGAFRPYLYTTIRNLACTWGSQSRDVQVDEIDTLESHESAEAPVARSLDRALTVSAYRALPTRWQTVLWYTEVEGLDPQEVAPIMGLTSNAVAALAYRAREGLRKAWLQAHVTDATASGACQWVVTRLGEHSRHSLTEREEQRLTGHLAICAKCAIVSEEVDDVGARLAMVMIPLLLGGVAGGTLLASLGSVAGAGTGVATASAIPALPSGIGAAAAGAGASGAAAGGSAGVLAVAASVVIVAGAGVGVGVVTTTDAGSDSASGDRASSQTQASAGNAAGTGSTASDDSTGTASDGRDAAQDLATSIPDSLLTRPGPTDPVITVDPDLPGLADDPTLGGTVDKTLDGVGETVDKVTDTVDKVGDTGDKIVDRVVPPKKDRKGSGVGDTVNDVTDSVDDVTGEVDDLVDDVVGGLGSGLGGLLGGGRKG